ncbi:MAG: hypothetical protein AAB540_05135 [Patescibacteria group bacterium]
MAPEDPRNQGNPPDQETLRREMRCYIPINLPEEVLRRIFSNIRFFKILQFIDDRVRAVISPGILGCRFNGQEASKLASPQSPGSLHAGLWDVSDLSDALYCHVPYFEANPGVPQGGKPFNLTMSVSHIISDEGDEGIVVEASPSNLLKAHRNAFAGGEHFGGEICEYIEAGKAGTELPVTALVMEIPGEFSDEWIQAINHFADGNNMLGYRHVTRFRRPNLATAMQSAISRVKTPGVINTERGFNPSSVVTNEKGPNGKPIVVSCYPSWNKIILAEDDGNLDNSPTPTRTMLVRPMFAMPSSEDAENLI